MKSDFHALCAELYTTFEKYGETLAEERLLDRVAAALRTHAALSRPAPEAGEPEPTFAPEEAELHQAPWSYLSPPAVDCPDPTP